MVDDIATILSGTLSGTPKKVSKGDFKTKIEGKITTLQTSPKPEDKALANRLKKEVLDADFFTEWDGDMNDELDEKELAAGLRDLRKAPPPKTISGGLKSVDEVPLPLKLTMKSKELKEGGYLKNSLDKYRGDRSINDNKPHNNINKDIIANPFEIIEVVDPSATPPTTVVNNFTPFATTDNYIAIPTYEGDYKIDSTGKDVTRLSGYAIPVKGFELFAANNPAERVWVRFPGRDFSDATEALGDVTDLPSNQIDTSTPEGVEALSKYIRKHLFLDSAGKLTFDKVRNFPGVLIYRGKGAEELNKQFVAKKPDRR